MSNRQRSKITSRNVNSGTKRRDEFQKPMKSEQIRAFRDREYEQIEAEVKERSKKVDEEIAIMMEKVKQKQKLVPGKSSTGIDPASRFGGSRSLSSGTRPNNTSVEPPSAGLSRYKAGSIENDSLQNIGSITASGLAVDGRGLNSLSLDPSQVFQQTQMKNQTLQSTNKKFEKLRYEREKEMTEEERDHLITFLAKLKIMTEDRNLTNNELREVFLPSDLYSEGEVEIPINEFASILQTELGLPITKPEQLLLMEEYGFTNGMIDVRAILSDAGLWDGEQVPSSKSPTPNQKANFPLSDIGSPEKKEMIDSLEFSPLSSPVFSRYEKLLKSPDGRKTATLSNQKNSSSRKPLIDDKKGLLEQTDRTLLDIHELHNLVEEAVNPNHSDETLDALSLSRKKSDADRQRAAYEQTLDHQQELMDNLLQADDIISTQIGKPPKGAADRTRKEQLEEDEFLDLRKSNASLRKKNDENSAEDALLQNSKIQKIIQENEKLKNELKSFDANFFEELEDMKFRYTRLLEMVGEDPVVDNHISASLNTRRDTRSISPNARTANLPLNRLSWSTRNSMRAIDRASYTSPIVQGRRNLGDTRSISPSRRGLEPAGGNFRSGQESLLLSTRDSGRSSPPRRTLLDSGFHGIGEGRNSVAPDEIGGNFMNLCERRLVFELSSHQKPADVTALLIHKVMDVAGRNKATEMESVPDLPQCITVKQLQDIIQQLGLQMNQKELEMLCSGFASNGKGGIDAKEFCDMIRSLVYNLLGNHYQSGTMTRGGFQGTAGTKGGSRSQREFEKEKEKEFNEEFMRLLRDVCYSIITYDRKSVIGSSNNLYQTLLKPFVEIDFKATGMISFLDFVTVLKEMGVLLSRDEYKLLARPFLLDSSALPAESTHPSSNLNHLDSFRHSLLTGSLNGKMKTNEKFTNFLHSHNLKDSLQRSAMTSDYSLDDIQEESMISYPDFVQQLVKELQQYLDKKGGIPTLSENKRLPWIIQEFELIDLLLTQLENMNASHRRKTLITLQYALENADLSQSGELDGFAILSALLNSGFRLQRYHRVQLLKAAEAFGGQLEYRRLVIALLQTAINWSQTERTIIFKVLKSMGNTMEDRRLWLAKMKKELMERVSQTQLSRKAAYLSNSSSNVPGGSKQYPRTFLSPSDQDVFSLPIPPTIFLHVLRDLNVQFTPEEEATLLDCLDTERIIKLQMKQLKNLTKRHQYLLQQELQEDLPDKYNKDTQAIQQKIHSLLWNDDSSSSISAMNKTGLPMIDYYSFIQFVSRHCGTWIDSRPDLHALLTKILKHVYQPETMITELAHLFTSFDEKRNGLVSLRSFLVCCHRCRLFANVEEQILHDLAETLVVDGVGEIPYQDFLLQLKGIHLKISQEQQDMILASQQDQYRSQGLSAKQAVPLVTIVRQFLDNATDGEFQTLLPLRNYLLQFMDLETMMMTVPDFQRLLREFSIVYQAQELETLLLEVGVDFELASPYDIADDQLTGGRNMSDSNSVMRMVEMPKLLSKLMKARLPWYERNLPLVKKLLTSLAKVAKQSQDNDDRKPGGEDAVMNINTMEMMNMKIVHKIISRINAFSFEDLSDFSNNDQLPLGGRKSKTGGRGTSHDVSDVLQTNSATASSSQQQHRLIEWNIFEYILKSLGILLTRQEIQFLCDVCDPYPECHRINPYILMDLLYVFRHPPKNKSVMIDGEERSIETGGGRGGGDDENENLSEAALYSLNHLQTLIWRAKDSSFLPIHASNRSKSNSTAKKNAFHSKYLHEEDFTSTTLSGSNNKDYSYHYQPYRNEEQWQLDILSICKGFDYYNNGFLSFPDFLMILKLINVTISMDLLRDIPFINMNTELVNYSKLFKYLFNTSNLSKSQKFHLTRKDSSSMLNDNDDDDLLGQSGKRRIGTGKNGNTSLTSNKKEKHANTKEVSLPHAIQLLLTRIRSNISVFILNDHTMQEAWIELLKVFNQFDKQEKNYITSRDFLLAISVLLTSSSIFNNDNNNSHNKYVNPNIYEKQEDLLFTKLEWEEILYYFQYDENDAKRKGKSNGIYDEDDDDHHKQPINVLEDMKVNYLFFCEMVLNIKEIEKKLKELQRFIHQKSLSTSSSSRSIRGGGRGGGGGGDEIDDFFADIQKDQSQHRLSQKTTMMKSQSQALRQRELTMGTVRDHVTSPSRRQSSLSPSKQRGGVSMRGGREFSVEDDPIAKRFQQSNQKYQDLMSNRQYGDHSRTSSGSGPHMQPHPSNRTSYMREENIFRETAGGRPSSASTVTRRPSSASASHGGRDSMSENAMTVSRKEINDRKKEIARDGRGGGTGGGGYSQSASSKQLYQSSHNNRSTSTGKTVRFNWTS